MANRLEGETSTYLAQHAENPVDWYPWGEEALARARREDKLIFLSIGYSACHWCHVMERESFEDATVAEALNRDFVSIKVDREERPDLDEIYMAATMLYSGGHGGWPMSVFLAPDLRPVFAGTYFPREDSYGRPGIKSLLQYLQRQWQLDRTELLSNGDKVVKALQRMQTQAAGPGTLPDEGHVERAAAEIYRSFDHARGGIASGSNKFPQSLSLELFLRVARATGATRYREAAEGTLERIVQGGIYDHLGGGLHRYSTDPDWLVPHFEKMLYDQALVASVLLDARQATADGARRRLFDVATRGICEYVLQNLRTMEGSFFSSEDADSEGQEGKFYIWTLQEVEGALEDLDARLTVSHFGISEAGNWMHPGDAHVPSGPKNVLHVARSAEVLAKLHDLTAEEVEARLAASRATLEQLRHKRPLPELDEKVLTGWNGLMIAALAKAAVVLPEHAYGEAAERAADFLLRKVCREGRLLATYGQGRARLMAYSTDYAFLIDGLIAVYEWNAETEYLLQAERLTESLIEHYWDASGAGFFLTAADHEELLVRSKTVQDGAVPAANSVMAMSLQKLAILLGRDDYRAKAEALLGTFVDPSLRTVFQQERLLSALDAWHQGWDEIAVVGPPDDPRTQALLRAVHADYRPNKVIARIAGPGAPGSERLPLLADRGMVDGKPTAYVCRDYVCQAPVTDPALLFAASPERSTAVSDRG